MHSPEDSGQNEGESRRNEEALSRRAISLGRETVELIRDVVVLVGLARAGDFGEKVAMGTLVEDMDVLEVSLNVGDAFLCIDARMVGADK